MTRGRELVLYVAVALVAGLLVAVVFSRWPAPTARQSPVSIEHTSIDELAEKLDKLEEKLDYRLYNIEIDLLELKELVAPKKEGF